MKTLEDVGRGDDGLHFENEWRERAKNNEVFLVEIWLADETPGDPNAIVAILTYENSAGEVETHNLLNAGHQYK